jgi:hypothetical protein
MNLKTFPKAAHEYTLEKINQRNYEREGKPEHKFDTALELDLELDL